MTACTFLLCLYSEILQKDFLRKNVKEVLSVNIILSVILDGIGLESTFWALKYSFGVIVKINKFIVYVYYSLHIKNAYCIWDVRVSSC